MRKLLTTKLAFASIYLLFTVLLVSGVSVKYAYSQSTNDGNVCDSLTGAEYGLCNAYCNAMDCANPNHKASDRACERVQHNYEKKTGETLLPCDPCYNKNCPAGESCVDGECQCGGNVCNTDEMCEQGKCMTPCNTQADCTYPEDCTAEGFCVDPCANLAAVADCPCDFHQVPQDNQCWLACNDTRCFPTVFAPCSTKNCTYQTSAVGGCVLFIRDSSGLAVGELSVSQEGTPGTNYCNIDTEQRDACNASISGGANDLTQNELATCFCRLSQYTNELYNAGINITGGSYPYSCYP